MKMSSKRQKANLNWTKHIFFPPNVTGKPTHAGRGQHFTRLEARTRSWVLDQTDRLPAAQLQVSQRAASRHNKTQQTTV